MFIYNDRAQPTDDIFQVFVPSDAETLEPGTDMGKIASEFWVRFSVVFANELRDNWFEVLADVGRFLSGDGKKALKSKEEVLEFLKRHGKIQFLPSLTINLREIVNTLFQG